MVLCMMDTKSHGSSPWYILAKSDGLKIDVAHLDLMKSGLERDVPVHNSKNISIFISKIVE